MAISLPFNLAAMWFNGKSKKDLGSMGSVPIDLLVA
jgi:hypothetical protein